MATQSQRVEELFEQARHLASSNERAAFLQHACQGEEVLRRRVERLLAMQGEAEAFFTTSEVEEVLPGGRELVQFVKKERAPPGEGPGTVIGRYQLIEPIGEGGFGSVYLAEQLAPVRRRVALKIIKAGLDTREVVVRFEAERQALALMDHPNIARVLDAGATETGRPFFVMELVQGTRITDYCDQHQLGTRPRLELFIQVCQAVQHAHQKGIIHRDIKPSNVLVVEQDGQPVPKVIDFGIAKAIEQPLTDLPAVTRLHQFVGTPAYMSPEQAEIGAADVDTRTDVYSLAVLLYELLTGQTPFEPGELMKASLDEMRRRIREEEPPRPTTRLRTLPQGDLTTVSTRRRAEPARLLGQIRGDLDWIVMKGLEKDRRRRYETANALADDLRRHLHHEPVVARPPSRAYRVQKLVRRNKLVFAAGTVVAVALIMALAVSLLLLARERRALAREEVALQRAQTSERTAQESLWHSLLAQARANRLSGLLGRRQLGLTAISEAVRLRPSVALRNEAIAHLAMLDFEEIPGLGLADDNAVHFSFDPDLERQAVLWRDRSVSVLRVSDGRELFRWDTVLGFWHLDWSPDGRYLRLGDGDQVVVLETGEGRARLRMSGVADSAFSPDGQVLAVMRWGGAVQFLDMEGGDAPLPWLLPQGEPRREPYKMVFHPHGKFLALAVRRNVELWDWQEGKRLQTIPCPSEVSNLACHKSFLAIGTWLGEVCLYDLRTRHWRQFQAHKDYVSRLLFHPETELLVSGSWDDTCCFWDPASGEALLRNQGGLALSFNRSGTHLAFSRRLASGIWRTLAPVAFQSLGCADPSDWLARMPTEVWDFSPDGRWLVASKLTGVCLLDLTTGNQRVQPPLPGAGFAFFDAVGGLLVVGAKDRLLFHPVRTNAAPAGPPLILESASTMPLPGLLVDSKAQMRADRRQLIVGSGHRALVMDLDQSHHVVWLTNAPFASYPSISPDGRWAATGTFHGDGAYLWDAQTGQRLALLQPGDAATVFCPTCPLLAIASLQECRVYQTGTWQLLYSLPLGSGNSLPGSVCFSPDGRWLALQYDRYTIQLIEALTGQLIASFPSPNPQILQTIRFSPDGVFLALGTRASQVHLWNLRELRAELAKLGLDW